MSIFSQGLAQSVQARLISHARKHQLDPNLVLSRFASERLLYRLTQSGHGERFVLKGAFLLLVWLGETVRPTRDVDLLGYGDLSPESLAKIFQEVCAHSVEPDGVIFDPGSVEVADIRAEDFYGGQRVTLRGLLGKTRLYVQVDVGIGDAVTPQPTWLSYPTLLSLPQPRLRAYRPETSIAEKVHAMVERGMANSRMRNFFDIHALAQAFVFDSQILAEALRQTFERRGTPLPLQVPVGLSTSFAASPEKLTQSRGFLLRSGLSPEKLPLDSVVSFLSTFLAPALELARTGTGLSSAWPPGGPWSTAMRLEPDPSIDAAP